MKKLTLFFLLICGPLMAQDPILNLNKPEREQWFTELGFGMFIHWSYDVVLGTVISHSMVGASEQYLDRYVNELPQYFNPTQFEPEKWAKQAKLAGMKYVVFTTKHHNGFCMWDTKTTDYDIMNTPFGKDATKMVIDAFRKEGLAIGLYFSPDDFHFLYEQGTLISRRREEATPEGNPELTAFIKKQMRELMTNYGKIDLVFLDGIDQFGKTELAKVCWEIDPECVVTRGAIETPEQNIPNTPIPAPWEACYTLGDQWQFRPTNENYKSAWEVLQMLVDIRAKGGNLLLNFGPDAEGKIPDLQAGVLNEVSLWMFINREALENTTPFNIVREGNVWFTRSRSENAVYAILFEKDWALGERRNILLSTIKPTANTEVSVLGHNGQVLEYETEVDPAPRFFDSKDGLLLSIMRAQRIYNDRKWPNPIVVKMTNVAYAGE